MSAFSWNRAKSNVSSPRAMARRPNACAGRRLARGPCARCLRNAATYRCDSPLSLRAILPSIVNAEFTGEALDALHRFIHQVLRADNFFFEAVGVDGGLLFQGQ